MLAGGEGAARDAIDEDLDARLRRASAQQPHVIGRALVAERRGHRAMHREQRIGEGELQLGERAGHSWLRCGMVTRLATEEVAAAIGSVGRGR